LAEVVLILLVRLAVLKLLLLLLLLLAKEVRPGAPKEFLSPAWPPKEAPPPAIPPPMYDPLNELMPAPVLNDPREVSLFEEDAEEENQLDDDFLPLP
jgi:hypothetical protein